MNLVITPQSQEELNAYYLFRWQQLRAPWQQPQGSEKDELESQALHRMIIDQDTKSVIAVARLHFDDQFTAQVRYVAVDGGQQGKGIGRILMDELEKVARERGITSVNLNAREVSLAFYQALGYQLIEKSHLLYGEIQHFLMSKSLEASEAIEQSLANTLQEIWHETIPLSKAMNLNACYYDRKKFITSCDPQFNKNLHNTMFAGSIYTLATLTGWGWVYFQLQHLALDADIVLADANIRYLRPVSGAGHGVVTAEEVKGDLTPIENGRHGKMNITVHIYCGESLCAVFTGKYVAIAKTKQT
ncbi:bifunctional GNAT family N-acetyltransferase/hotdog fold thioesterase [Thalassotalea atypica]|uniref:bifunctional GNAT family N-acetyltransferase/hotdog fold thioesterase n=1 Tax=Thalassotalea atypica TaxID=2054316 RepID=UPI0025741434|nr:bifunctional GNAT family N-acetyltransferase/hotdog fold thioesterase [Thalassotalea atypica]